MFVIKISHDNQGRADQQLGITGRLLDNALTYQLTASGDNQAQQHAKSGLSR
ncbi:hypothetical protein [Providencia sp. NPDC089923]|uniref:hypothetical protein n=1 Tax=Providencia sp. NPDC089923 TaxID=3415004 RepID=UPI003C2E289A